jgi:hypothetical protein
MSLADLELPFVALVSSVHALHPKQYLAFGRERLRSPHNTLGWPGVFAVVDLVWGGII